MGEIGWSHNRVILDRCKDDLEREFYLRMTRRMGWTRRVGGAVVGGAGMSERVMCQDVGWLNVDSCAMEDFGEPRTG